MARTAAARVVAAVVLCAISGGARAELATCRDDAMIVFDASGSMAGTDLNGPPTPRIARVKQALQRFCRALPPTAGSVSSTTDPDPRPTSATTSSCNSSRFPTPLVPSWQSSSGSFRWGARR